ncbi:MAG TPA: (2Fe-2S)-binding protein, partial [Cyanothece sp. UBA12306]|nr:(2Fe-2S)-binding protein [Cyanothece sp. UBA12306]
IPWADGSNAELPPPQRDKQQLFDVWTTHTQHCRVCQDALKNINRATIFAYIGAVVCLTLGIIIDARTVAMTVASQTPEATGSWLTMAPSGGFWVAIAGAIILGLGGYLLKKLSRLFYVYEFEHSHND